MTVLTVIPCRAGTKRLPGKNMADLAGRPLLDHTLVPALRRRAFGTVVVSTDDLDVAARATKLGASPPFDRPMELAGDQATNVEVCLHVLDRVRAKKLTDTPRILVLLQVTSPFRPWLDCEHMLSTMTSDNRIPAIVAVSKMSYSRLESEFVPQKNKSPPQTEFLFDISKKKRELTPCGAFYAIRVDSLVSHRSFLPPGTRGFEVDPVSSIDIDSQQDLELARMTVSATPNRIDSVYRS